MNKIDSIIIHCSATKAGQDLRAKDNDITALVDQGYGCLFLTFRIVPAVGGLDVNGRPADTRTKAQKNALRDLVAKLCKEYDIVELLGHRDTSPDLDGSGEVELAEYIKACPCFDVRSEFSNFLRNTVVKP